MQEENKPDYWCNSTATTYTISNFTAYESKQNFVRFDDTQTLSDTNKSTARNNIGAASVNDLSNETSARETADSNLQTQIDSLGTADTNLQTQINTINTTLGNISTAIDTINGEVV